MKDNFTPEKQLEFTRRRTIGCFKCKHSKREKEKSFCQLIKSGLIKNHDADYPNETKHTCLDWSDRHVKK